MDDATFDVLDRQVTNQGGTYAEHTRPNLIKELDRRLLVVEENTESNAAEIVTIKGDIVNIKDDMKSQKNNESVIQENAAASVFSELNNRNQRRLNIVVHGLVEPDGTIKDGDARIAKDKQTIQELMSEIQIDLQVNEVLKFAKRLGARSEHGNKPRPLLLGFKNSEHKEMMLDNARKLNEKDEPWKSVSIVQDLTVMQRGEEAKMREEAQRLTGELSEDEKKNWMFKVVGRRGERRIVKASLAQLHQGPATRGRTHRK